jgi:heat shock protein HslJ
MRTPFSLGLALVATLVLAGCSAGGAAPASPAASPQASADPGPPTAADLDGRTFLGSGTTGRQLAPGSFVRMTFEGVRLGVSAGCNQMSGEYEVVDGILKVGPMMTTDMACEEPLMAQDQWLAGFLPDATVRLAGDTLTLTAGPDSLTLIDEETANPDRPLEGTRWIVESIVAGDAVSSLPLGTRAALVFDGGTLRAEPGCNTGSGSYTVDGSDLTIGAIATTKMGCQGPAMELEAAVLRVLDGQVTFAIDADTLTLTNGAAGLILKAAA